jgi:hypothetical protein
MRLRLLLVPLLLCTSSVAAAQTASPDTSNIVVEGMKDRAKRLRSFVRELTPSTLTYNQLTRWEVPVCPAAFGLTPQQRSYVVERMRTLAKAVDVPLAKPDCDPNVIVIVTSDKSALLAGLEKKHPNYFPADWSDHRIHELERDTEPVASWQFEGVVSTDGIRLSDTTASNDTVDPAGLVAATIATTAPASRLRPPGRHDVLTSILVVQTSALAGITTTQFADYAAMRTFVHTEPEKLRASPSETILKVMDAPMGTAVPLSLTNWDFSFLKAYYGSGTRSYANVQRSEIAHRMKGELDREQASQPQN